MKKTLLALILVLLLTPSYLRAENGSFDNLAVSGVVAVGTASPVSRAEIVNTMPAASNNTMLTLYNPTHAADSRAGMTFQTGNARVEAYIQGGNDGAGRMDLDVNGKMMLKATGNVGIGTAAPEARFHVSTFSQGWAGYIYNGGATDGRGLLVQSGTGSPLSVYAGNNVAVTVNSSGNVGIGTDNPGSNKLYVAGNGYTAGYSYATNSNCSSSDIRLKKDITPLTNATSLIENLQGVRFNWKAEEYKDKNFDTSPQIGLIAQDVEKVVPEVVKTDSEGFKAVSYEKLTAVLIEALKEQQKALEAQQKEIKSLRADIEQLKSR